MDVEKTLMQAIYDKWHLLPEDIGKTLITQFGIDVPAGKRVKSPDEVRLAASELGYPLVAKALAPDPIHKSERGGVKVGLGNDSALERATEELWNLSPGVPLLIEKMVAQGVELIVGLTNDEHFGPCLMMGTGSLFADLFQDVSFIMLPAPRGDLLKALKDLKGYRLLTGFRGRPAYDIDRIVDIIMALARFGIEAMGYYESVDINPLVVNE